MQAILMIVGLGGGVNACADMPRKGALPRAAYASPISDVSDIAAFPGL